MWTKQLILTWPFVESYGASCVICLSVCLSVSFSLSPTPHSAVSPCYVDETADLDMAVRRILWGKLCNLGQTCIAPDYILCPRAVQDGLVNKVKEVLKEWYGEDLKKSPHLGRIVAERHIE